MVAVKEAAGQYGAGNATIILDDLSCSGEERNLLQCELGGPRLHTCDISEVAGVQCGGDALYNCTCYCMYSVYCIRTFGSIATTVLLIFRESKTFANLIASAYDKNKITIILY